MAPHAVHGAAAFAVAQVQAQIVAVGGIRIAQAAVQAQAGLLAAVAAQRDLAFGKIAGLGQLGDVVERAAHAAGAVEKARCPAYGLDAVVDPAVHRARGNRILHIDAVEQLADRGAAETAPAHARIAGRAVGGHARHGAQHLLGVLRARGFDGGAVDHLHAGRCFEQAQAQAAAGAGALAQRQQAQRSWRAAFGDLDGGQFGLWGCGAGIKRRKRAQRAQRNGQQSR